MLSSAVATPPDAPSATTAPPMAASPLAARTQRSDRLDFPVFAFPPVMNVARSGRFLLDKPAAFARRSREQVSRLGLQVELPRVDGSGFAKIGVLDRRRAERDTRRLADIVGDIRDLLGGVVGMGRDHDRAVENLE